MSIQKKHEYATMALPHKMVGGCNQSLHCSELVYTHGSVSQGHCRVSGRGTYEGVKGQGGKRGVL